MSTYGHRPPGAYENGSYYGVNRALATPIPVGTPLSSTSTSAEPFRIIGEDGTELGRFQSRAVATAVLYRAWSSGQICKMVS